MILKAYDSLLNNKYPFPKIGWVGGLFREHLYGDITLRCISHHIRWAGGVFNRSNWAEVMLGSQVLQVVEEVVYDLSIRGLNKSAKEDKDDVVEGDQKKEET